MEGFVEYCEYIGAYSDLSSSCGFHSPKIDHHLLTDNSSFFSDAGTTVSTPRSGVDEDVYMLASSHPKKRTGRKKFKETRHPVYRGVRMRNSNRWVCEVREPNKRNRIWLGTYPTAEMAARAHDVAALALRGIKGCLNFADSAWRLPKPASNDPEDIQRAAAEAAAIFSVDEEEEGEGGVEDADNLVEESAAISTVDEDTEARNGDDSSANYELYGKCKKNAFYYMEDEAIFDMPGLLNDMAEGLLQLPPKYDLNGDFSWNMDTLDKESDMSLWNYSM